MPRSPPPADRASAATPRREIFCAEGLAWLEANPAPPAAGVVTSLPDVSEFRGSFAAWRSWFLDAAARIIRWVPENGAAVFFQSDIRHAGAWVDKGYLVQAAAEAVPARVVWHTIVCRVTPGTVTADRPGYAHMIGVSRAGPSVVPCDGHGPDVLPDAGFKPAGGAMGEAACGLACSYLRERVGTTCIVDPFCGYGTSLAVANALGLDAIGVDWNARRCRAARARTLAPV